MDEDKELEKNTPITVDELRSRIAAIDDVIEEMIDNRAPFPERVLRRQELIRDFMAAQIEDKGRYGHIFKTEKGSIYFVLQTGQSLRVKLDSSEENQDPHLKIEPICNKIFFVDESQLGEFMEMRSRGSFQEKIIGKAIKTTECRVGVIPFEFGIRHMSPIQYSEELGKIVIEGDDNGDFASGYHIGHTITEVIK